MKPGSGDLATVAVNLLGVVEHPVIGDSPYRIGSDGRPYVPVGDGGLVLGAQFGDSVFGTLTDHVAPGAEGAVIGKRGESGRLIAGFAQGDLARMRPGDQVSVRGSGQGFRPRWLPANVSTMNIDPDLLAALQVTVSRGTVSRGTVEVNVRSLPPARLAGNGLGRPAAVGPRPAGDR